MDGVNEKLFMKIYDVTIENTKTLSKICEQVDTLENLQKSQQKILDKLSEDFAGNKELLKTFKDTKIEMQALEKKIAFDIDKVKERIDALEKKSGENALKAWQKIGGVALTVIVTALVTALIAMLKK